MNRNRKQKIIELSKGLVKKSSNVFCLQSDYCSTFSEEVLFIRVEYDQVH